MINYWDNVIKLWLGPASKGSIDATRPLNGCSYYKDLNIEVNIECEQLPLFHHKSINSFLCPAHLPEPYWGDPENCSIVILNYNPGGGTGMDIHAYKFTNGNPKFLPFPPNTMIDYVYKHSYSCLAKDFPIWKIKIPHGREWLNSYAGRKWWLEKKNWVNHIVCAKSNGIDTETIPPFAMELCGWHSKNWPGGIVKQMLGDCNIHSMLVKRFLCPFLRQ